MNRGILARLQPLLAYVSATSPMPSLVSLPDSCDRKLALLFADYANERILPSKHFAFAVCIDGTHNLCLVTKTQWNLLVAHATDDPALLAMYENKV